MPNIEEFQETRVLCIGDVMLDRFLYGSVDRISPEAPVPVFKFKSEKVTLGGAGNVVANLAALGSHVMFLGIVGKDSAGRKISSMLTQTGCRSHLLRVDEYPTIEKIRLIAESNHICRFDREERIPMEITLVQRFRKTMEKVVEKSDIVLLSDYNKGVLTHETIQEIISICAKHGKRVLVDPKGSDYSKYAGAFLLKPNRKEFEAATGIELDPSHENFEDHLRCGAAKLFAEQGIGALLVTLSEFGMAYICAEDPRTVKRIPTVAREVFDVSGAGDTVLATLGISLASGFSIEDAMVLANIASGIVVSKVGTAVVTRGELLEAVHGHETHSRVKRKIFSANELVWHLKALKDDGKTIGFTNGCFDCLHLGHLDSFFQAKQHCDILVVGVNSDASVRKLKGENRPIQDENTRAGILAALECVDFVVVFDEDTALPLVELIRPDMIAKEGYEISRWPEAQKVISWGGAAVELKRCGDYSTSSMLKKLGK